MNIYQADIMMYGTKSLNDALQAAGVKVECFNGKWVVNRGVPLSSFKCPTCEDKGRVYQRWPNELVPCPQENCEAGKKARAAEPFGNDAAFVLHVSPGKNKIAWEQGVHSAASEYTPLIAHLLRALHSAIFAATSAKG